MPSFTPAQCDTDPILRYFDGRTNSLADAAITEQFCALAGFIVTDISRSAERTVALRKLLEAKDAAMRASLPEKKPVRDDQAEAVEEIDEGVRFTGRNPEEPLPFRED